MALETRATAMIQKAITSKYQNAIAMRPGMLINRVDGTKR